VLVRAALFSLLERGYRQALIPAVGTPAARAFYEALLAKDDPGLRQPTVASIDKIALADVEGFAKRDLRPDLATLVVVGDVDPCDSRVGRLASRLSTTSIAASPLWRCGGWPREP